MENKDLNSVKRGDIYYADLEPVIGAEQGGIRPVLIIQNDKGNIHSPTVIVAVISRSMRHGYIPTHIRLNGRQYGLSGKCTIKLEHIRTIDKERLLSYVGHLDKNKMDEVDLALEISVGTIDAGYRELINMKKLT